MNRVEQKRFIQGVFAGVFCEPPLVEWRHHPSFERMGSWCINKWLWIYSVKTGWAIEVRKPTAHAFASLPCIKELHAQPSLRDTFWGAVIAAVQHEAHLQGHNHIDAQCEKMGYATQSSHGRDAPGQSEAGSPSAN